MSYSEAIERLQGSGQAFKFPVEWGCNLQSEHERFLTEQYRQGAGFLSPTTRRSIKAFYMRLNDDGRTVAAMDLLVPGVGEIIGGSQREERLEVLERAHAFAAARAGERSGGTSIRAAGAVARTPVSVWGSSGC